MNDHLKLLAILAHPDDESLGMGSVIAKYSAEGARIDLICATRGERGWMGNEKDNPGMEELGKIRTAELLCAAETLGIHRVYFLDYIDGDLDQADANEAMGRIAGIIREIRPHVAVTFGPDGVYGHPDHIAISQFTSGAVTLAADATYRDANNLPAHRVGKFYYFLNSAKIAGAYTRFFGDIKMEVDGGIRSFIGWDEWMCAASVDGSAYSRIALRAVNCHKSQTAVYGDLNQLPDKRIKALFGTRTFYRVFSFVNSGRSLETDLFQGIR